MSGFRDMIERDNRALFLNPKEFARLRTVVYDGSRYEDIPVVLTSLKEQERRRSASDHAEGLYKVAAVLQCALADLGGRQPEKGSRIKVNNAERGGGFFHEYYVAASICEMGLLRLELEDINERNHWNR